MSTTGDDRNPVERLAEEFLERRRRGEPATPEEYAELHPALAGEILALFPALLMMEEVGDSSLGHTGTFAGAAGAVVGAASGRLGDFRLIREVGRGGMGVVYEAEQESLGRRVALKVLPPGAFGDARQVRRFEREARSAARLHHTNIVPVFGVGSHEGTHFYVMQFIQGQGLDSVLEELKRLRGSRNDRAGGATGPGPAAPRRAEAADIARSLATGRLTSAGTNGPAEGAGDGTIAWMPGPSETRGSGPPVDGAGPVSSPGSSGISSLPETDQQFARGVARIGQQVAEALAYAHGQGILHRDIKPANLLLDREGNVWVADFGLAKAMDADDLTHTGDIVGTVRYMAPERFQGAGDGRVDIYALGLTLYELLALRPAFDASDRPSLIRQVTQEDPPPLRRLNRSVPPDLVTIVHKAMAREPAQRYATASALAEDLGRFLDGRPILARRVSPAERLWRWSARNPWLAGLSAALVLALAVGTVVASALAARATGAAARANEAASRAGAEARRAGALAAELMASLKESDRRLVTLDFERGQGLCEKDQIGPGLLWLLESWRAAERAGDAGWARTARTALADWQRRHARLKDIVSFDAPVWAVAASPDGRTILTGSGSIGSGAGTAQLRDAASGRPVGPPLAHRFAVLAVAFSPDGKTLLTGCADASARLWDAATGKPLGSAMNHRGAVAAVAFSPDGKSVVTGGYDRTARVWDAATGRPRGPLMVHQDWVLGVAFSPDGKTVLTGGGEYEARSGVARLWDASTGQPVGEPLRNQAPVNAVAFSPDGKTIITAGEDRMARLWDVASGRPAGPSLSHQGAVRAVVFSPDGRTILTGSHDNTARLWDAATGERLGSTMPHQGPVAAVAFSPDGKTAITCGWDKALRLWDADIGQARGPSLRHQGPVTSVAVSPDGKTVATGSGTLSGDEGAAQLWEPATGKPIGPPMPHQFAVLSLAFSPDGRTLLIGSGGLGGGAGTARLWDAATGQPAGPPLAHRLAVLSVAFSPDGKTLLTGCADASARLWDAATARPVGRPLVHQDRVNAVAFSPDGRTLLTGSWDGKARLWDAATGQPAGAVMAHRGRVVSVAFSPDGKTLLTGGDDLTARLWDAATGQPVGTPMTHQAWVSAVAFSPDGKTLITGSFDGNARLWDAATGQPVGPPMAHQDWVLAVAFSRDGRTIVTGGEDKVAQLWSVPVLPDDRARVATWVAVLTGLELDGQGRVAALDGAAWRERRRRLEGRGGPPATSDRARLDPILFGPDPTARAKAWVERQLWEKAEAAFTEAVEARPMDAAIRLERARFHAGRSRPEKADDDLVRAYALGSRDQALLERIAARPALLSRVAAESPGSAAPLWAKRGADRARRRQWADAEADFSRAVAGAPRDAAYWSGLATARAELGRPGEAADAFGRALDRTPGWSRADAPWRGSERFPIGKALAPYDEAFDRLARARPADRTLLIVRFDDLGRKGHWEEAAAVAARFVALDPDEQFAWYDLAALRLYLGDVEGYRLACREMLARFGATTRPEVARRTFLAISLRRDSVAEADRPRVARLAAVDTDRTSRWSVLARDVAAFWEGRYAEACAGLDRTASQFRETPESPSPAEAWIHFLRGMAFQKMGRPAEARRELDAGVAWLGRNTPRFDRGETLGNSWHDHARAAIYRRQAEALIVYDPIFPADPFAR